MLLSTYLLIAFGTAALANPFNFNIPKPNTKPAPTSLYKPKNTYLPSKEDAKLTEDEIIAAYKIPWHGVGLGKRDGDDE